MGSQANVMELQFLLFILLIFGCYDVSAKKGITCFSCQPRRGQPDWCSRDESEGNFKECKSDDPLVPVNTCYKSVTKDGVVTKGCAPSKWNHDYVYTSNVGINGEPNAKTYFCNKRLCNSSNNIIPTTLITLVITISILFLN